MYLLKPVVTLPQSETHFCSYSQTSAEQQKLIHLMCFQQDLFKVVRSVFLLAHVLDVLPAESL